jgi:DGQHR domain-containing protein
MINFINENLISNKQRLKKERKRRLEENEDIKTSKDLSLENRLWMLLYDVGMTSLNEGRECKIKYGKEPNTQEKKVDIISESNDVRMYIECSIQNDSIKKIKTWSSEVEDIRKYDNQKKMNVVFIYCTDQELNTTEKKILKEKGIKLINEKTIEYFNTLLLINPKITYYQLLGYLLQDEQIKSKEKFFEVPVIKCKYGPKKDCFLFGIQPSNLIPLSNVLHRKFENDDFQSKNNTSYQRLIKKQKIKEIKKFIDDQRGVFPTNIIVSFERDVQFKKENELNGIQFGTLKIPNKFHTISIIDGQHRLFGYLDLEYADTDLIYVIGFEKMDLNTQIETFVNINEKQTKVSSSLMWDLSSEILDPSDLKFKISTIVKQLNEDPNSPFYGLVEYDSSPILSKTKNKLTLESICTSIKSLNIFGDLDLIFKQLKVNDDKDYSKKNIINLFFGIIKESNIEHWEREDKTLNLIRSNQGIGSLFILLRKFLEYIDENYKKDLKEDYFKTYENVFKELLTPVNVFFSQIDTKEKVKEKKRIGEGGKVEMFKEYCKLISKKNSNFYLEENEKEKFDLILEDLIKNNEKSNLEVKESFFIDCDNYRNTGNLEKNESMTTKIVKTIIAFMNQYNGGDLLIGIKNPTNEDIKIVGIDETDLKKYGNYDKYKNAITQKLNDPKIERLGRMPELTIKKYEDKTILLIEVKGLPRKRFEDNDLCLYDGDIQVRRNDNTQKLSVSELKNHCISVLQDFDQNQQDLEDE